MVAAARETTRPEASRGSGGGFGLNARPAGAYVIEGARVPAVDVTRIVLQVMLAALGVAFLLRRGHR